MTSMYDFAWGEEKIRNQNDGDDDADTDDANADDGNTWRVNPQN